MSIQRPTSPISETATEKPTEGMSPQVRQAIAIGGLLACLLIGAGLIYFFLASPSRRTVTVDPKAQTQDFSGLPPGMRGGGGGRQQPPQHVPPTVWQVDPNTWQAITKSAAMRITKQSNGGYDVLPYYFGRSVISQDMMAFIAAIVHAQQDEAMAKEWGLSPAQIAQIKNVKIGGAKMLASDAEKTELHQLAEDYVKAGGSSKADAEKKLLTRLEEIGKTNFDASHKAYLERFEAAKKIVTPEQLQKMTSR